MNGCRAVFLALLFMLGGEAARSLMAEELLVAADEIAHRHLAYIYGSEDSHSGGLDCSGFVQNVFHDACGLTLPNEADKQLDFLREHGQVWDSTASWKSSDLQPGDLIFYAGPTAIPRESLVSHVMIYCGRNVAVGAQGKGRQLDGAVSGVGYYHFWPSKPRGILGESGERFIGHRVIFAYGRLNPQAGILSPMLIDPASRTSLPPEPPAPVAGMGEPHCDFLQPIGGVSRFD